eukprot:m.83031 g.83031  ORF g.83031 m.83031 type:complete len:193 (+) comp8681_c4_seq1:232-810(+)
MGSSISNLWKSEEIKILMNGLDASGKTTILYQLKLGKVVETIPSVGFNVESINVDDKAIKLWDVGGRSGTQALMYHYMNDLDAYVFVVDANDPERIDEALALFEQYMTMMDEKSPTCPVAILANKQDLPHTMASSDIANRLDLIHRMGTRQWCVKLTHTQDISVPNPTLHQGKPKKGVGAVSLFLCISITVL